jgi:hypothetical protein
MNKGLTAIAGVAVSMALHISPAQAETSASDLAQKDKSMKQEVTLSSQLDLIELTASTSRDRHCGDRCDRHRHNVRGGGMIADQAEWVDYFDSLIVSNAAPRKTTEIV